MNQQTQWLKSPLSERPDCLELYRHLQIAAYHGPKRSMQLRHTTYSVGSDPTCDLVVQDPFVSKFHARLYISQGGFEIEDLDSKNGIFLNGLRIRHARLPREGQLRLGRSVFSWLENEILSSAELPEDWIVADPKMHRLLQELKMVARSSLPILIRGETGSGKEMLAELVHRWSARAAGAFITLNGGAAEGGLVDSELFGHVRGAYTGADANRVGAIAAANCGTLYLDEIGDLPQATQVRLLRAFENGEVKALGSDKIQHVDVRLVTATSQDIECLMEEEKFRIDFYYRIAGHVIYVPPLRDRPADIAAISKHMVQKYDMSLDPEAEARLLAHAWPGNIRELRNVVDRAMLLAKESASPIIMADQIVFSASHQSIVEAKSEQRLTLEQLEEQAIRVALQRTGWSRSVVAKELGIARSTLFEKMKKYKLQENAAHSITRL